MNRYEGVFIFQRSLTEEALEEALAGLRKDVERFGGRVHSATRLGKRNLAAAIRKQESGQFVVADFLMEGNRLADFRARLKMNDQILRAQILRKPASAASAQGE